MLHPRMELLDQILRSVFLVAFRLRRSVATEDHEGAAEQTTQEVEPALVVLVQATVQLLPVVAEPLTLSTQPHTQVAVVVVQVAVMPLPTAEQVVAVMVAQRGVLVR